MCILRCETRDPVVLLPDEIDGAPVTALGRYVLSGRAPDLSGRDTFSVRVTCGGPLPVHEADSIRAVTLPKQLKTVGSYAFYNCRSLEELTMTDSVSAFDGGSLMNCLSLHRIRLLAPPGGATCLPKILGETASELDVRFLHGDACTPLLFPAYTEELEDLSPAHIFQRRIHGAGYSYRQCFDGAALNFRQYDRALSELAERHDFYGRGTGRGAPARRALCSVGQRTRGLSRPPARARRPARLCARKQGDSVSLHVLLSLSVLSDAGIDAACTAAREAGQTAALSVLLAAAGPSKAARTRKNHSICKEARPCSPNDGPISGAKSCFPPAASFI